MDPSFLPYKRSGKVYDQLKTAARYLDFSRFELIPALIATVFGASKKRHHL